MSENRGVAAYHGIEVELAGPKADLLAAIREIGALMQIAGVKNTQVNEWVYRSLAALDSSDEKAAEQLTEVPAIKLHYLKACTLAAAVPPECRPYTQSKTLMQVRFRVAQAVGDR